MATAASLHKYIFKGKSYKQLLRDSGLMRIYAEMKGQTADKLEVDLADFKNNAGKVFLPGGAKGLKFLKHFVKEEGVLTSYGTISYDEDDDNEFDLYMVNELLHFIGYAEKDEVLDKMFHEGRLINLAKLNNGRNYRGAPAKASSVTNSSSEANRSSVGNWINESNNNLEGFNLSAANLRAIRRAKESSITKKGRKQRHSPHTRKIKHKPDHRNEKK